MVFRIAFLSGKLRPAMPLRNQATKLFNLDYLLLLIFSHIAPNEKWGTHRFAPMLAFVPQVAGLASKSCLIGVGVLLDP
jgi:hypothetical protein